MDPDIEVESLEEMRYADLQKLAKQCGIKANMKSDKLIKALQDYYKTQNDSSSGEDHSQSASNTEESAESSEECADEAPGKSKAKGKRGRKGKKATKEMVEPVVTSPKSSGTPKQLSTTVQEKKATPKPATPKQATPKGVSPQIKRNTPVRISGVSSLAKTPDSQKLTPGRRNTPSLSEGKQSQGSQQKAQKRRASSLGVVESTGPHSQTKRPRTSVGSKPQTPKTPTSNQKRSSLPRSGKRNSSARKSGTGSRRNTYDKTSPGVKDLLDSMQDGMDDVQMKDSLMATLERKAKQRKIERQDSGEKPSSGEKTVSQIPRFAAFVQKKKAEESEKKMTPGNKNWAKIHERQFSKMKSIEDYVAEKRQKAEALTASVKKAKEIAEETRNAINSLKNCKTPPLSSSKMATARSKSVLSFKSPQPSSATSTMNATFSASKTPKRVTLAVTSTRPASATKENQSRKSLGAIPEEKRKSLVADDRRKSNKLTPFKPAGNQSLVKSQQKAKFDLKASLARPITWQPHKGKLKPMSFTTTGGPANKFQVNPKDVKVKTKDDRRNAQLTHRANQRFDVQMKRRGINL